MRLQRSIRRFSIPCVAIAALATISPSTSAAPGGRPAGTKGSDWTVMVGQNGRIAVFHKGAAAVETSMTFWGKGWAWVGCDQKHVSNSAGHLKFSASVPDLGVSLLGDAKSTATNVIRVDSVVRAKKAFPEVIGGCVQWDFKRDLPSFGGKMPDPELLPDGQGWRWRVSEDGPITLRVEGAARTLFEGTGRSSARTFLVADRIEPGARQIRMTLELPRGGQRIPNYAERYGTPDPATWYRAALAPGESPVDLSFLNRDDRPAGRKGFVRADGDRLVFADGTPARFWGTNLAAYPVFNTPPKVAAHQARRMARLGYNLVRIHHHDSDWVSPNVFGNNAKTTRHLNEKALAALDWWIKCLKDEGIYVWLDMSVGRTIKAGDGLTKGADEVKRQQGKLNGFNYYNDELQALMKEFQEQYLDHRNAHTGLRYKEDPAVVAVLITNENDATHHGCFSILPDHKNPFHNALWTAKYRAFAARTGLPEGQVAQTWVPGPSKIFLAQAEHEFNETMISDLRQAGVKAPLVTTNFWGEDPLYCLPSLTDGDLIDVHSYGGPEALSQNAHYQGNFISWIAMGQVYGKPLSVSEWNVEYPTVDRFTGPLYLASVAAFQGWDAPMIYNYTQVNFDPNPRPEKWSTFHDPSITAVMPAAALLFRRGHVGAARKTYCLRPEPADLFGRLLTPQSSAAIRSLAEQSRLTIGMPEVPELPWLKPTKPDADVIVVTDPDRDFIPEGQEFVRSDTGELTRDWSIGMQTIDTPRTQAVSGWIGGRKLSTRDASFESETKKAVIALSSVDDRPLAESRFILVTAVARTIPSPGDLAPYLSEPVRCRITLRSKVGALELLALGRDGRVAGKPALEHAGDAYSFTLPAEGGTHWFVLKPPAGSGGAAEPETGGESPAPKAG